MEAFHVSGVMVAMDARNTGITKVRFGLFEFDFSTRELRKQGRRLKLQDLPLRLLASLLQTPGELVTYEKLRSDLWGDTFVKFRGRASYGCAETA